MARRAHLQILHPTRLVAFAFASVIAVGTVLLALPVSTASGARPPILTAAFTATFRALDDSSWLSRAHSAGRARQLVNLIGYALAVNSLTLHRHRRRLAAAA